MALTTIAGYALLHSVFAQAGRMAWALFFARIVISFDLDGHSESFIVDLFLVNIAVAKVRQQKVMKSTC